MIYHLSGLNQQFTLILYIPLIQSLYHFKQVKTSIYFTMSKKNFHTFPDKSNIQDEDDEGSKHSPKIFQPKFFYFLDVFSKNIESTKKKEGRCEEYSRKNSRTSSKSNFSSYDIKERYRKRTNIFMREEYINNSTHFLKAIYTKMSKMGKSEETFRIQNRNGSQFIGKVQNGEKKQGKTFYKSGLQIQCSFKNNEFDGMSTITLTNGTKLQIKWNQGNANPCGKIIYRNGDIYIGEIKNFKKHGIGQLIIKKKNLLYIGQFEDGEITGQGTLMKNNETIHEGIWRKGKLILEEQISDVTKNFKSITSSSRML